RARPRREGCAPAQPRDAGPGENPLFRSENEPGMAARDRQSGWSRRNSLPTNYLGWKCHSTQDRLQVTVKDGLVCRKPRRTVCCSAGRDPPDRWPLAKELTAMLSVFCSPSRYTQGKNATASLGSELLRLGLRGPALIVAGRSASRLL